MKEKKTANPTQYKNQFQRERYDRIALQVKKGYRDELQSHAKERGESLNAFINRAISEAIQRDNT